MICSVSSETSTGKKWILFFEIDTFTILHIAMSRLFFFLLIVTNRLVFQWLHHYCSSKDFLCLEVVRIGALQNPKPLPSFSPKSNCGKVIRCDLGLFQGSLYMGCCRTSSASCCFLVSAVAMILIQKTAVACSTACKPPQIPLWMMHYPIIEVPGVLLKVIYPLKWYLPVFEHRFFVFFIHFPMV